MPFTLPKSSIFLAIFLLLGLISCTPQETTSEQVGELVTLPPNLSTQTATVPAITVSVTLSTPEVTPTPTVLAITPSITPTLIPATPTVTLISTLTYTETENFFQNQMVSNSECELPCWWGIKLGDSLEDVGQTFTQLGMPWLSIEPLNEANNNRKGVFGDGYADYRKDEQGMLHVDYKVYVGMEFYEYQNSIQYISINVDRPRANLELSEAEFTQDWEQYFLSSFLQKHGKPTQVFFSIRSVGDLMEIPQYSISLLYEEQGLAITYHIESTWLNEEYTQAEVCLDIKNVRALELSIFNPEQFDKWGGEFVPYQDENYQKATWETQMGMNLDTFYETYQNPDTLGCLVYSIN